MYLRLVPCLLPLLLGAADAPKLVDDFDAPWAISPWAPAKGTVTVATDGDADVNQVTIAFAKGFQWWGFGPAEPVVIPGKAQRIHLRIRGEKGQPLSLGFKDGWGRDKVDGKDLKHEFQGTGAWMDVVYTVPQSIVFPLTITGIGTHNWHTQDQESTVTFAIDALRVETDVSAVDPATGALAGWKADPGNANVTEPRVPILGATVTSAAVSHVFAGKPVAFDLTTRSWLPGTVAASVSWTVRSEDGAVVDQGTESFPVSDQDRRHLTPTIPTFGVYRLETVFTGDGQERGRDSIGFANLPKPLELSAEEHAASPYGMNVHGGRHVLVEPFADAGIRWYRDYSFNLHWLQRSKGADRSYTGWPNHRAIVDAYAQRGLGLLPCVVDTIPRANKETKAGSLPKPDRSLKAELFDAFSAFPEIRYWEVDNEYDLHGDSSRYEREVDWQHYRDYHKAFAETLKFVDEKAIAVENGRAGIWPELAEACVKSGDFAQIGVINIHHYCGADAPERNIGNHNTNYSDVFANRQRPSLFMDRMRATARVADSDGIDRQCWITEFGWDDLAGPKIPTALKTAYLPRGYLATLEAGIDKAFWFFDLSTSPEAANNFFDGCGLLDHRQQPVPALAAMAGMTQALPAPRWLGDIRGEGQIDGGILESRGKLVAALWTIDGTPATITVKAERLTDGYGNPLPAGPVTLGNLPVYAIGLAADEPLLRHRDYRLESEGFVEVAGGDACEVVVQVTNHRTSAMKGTLKPILPAGWTCTGGTTFDLAPEATTTLTLSVAVPKDQAVGEQTLRFLAEEGGKTVKTIEVRASVLTPLALNISALEGRPGATELTLRILNQSRSGVDAEVAFALPKSWSTAQTTIAVAGLKPDEMRTLTVPLTWSVDLKPGETATVSALTGDKPPVTLPIIPNHRRLVQVPDIVCDGNLGDWSETARIDPWMLGCKGIAADAAIYAGWRSDGLALAVDVANSERRLTNPRTFWSGEVLEVFLGTGDNPHKRSWRPDDHQFWLTPMAGEGRAYLGRWNRGTDQPATAYDLDGTVSKVVATETGYRMEVIIPAKHIQGWAPTAGKTLGIALCLTAYGHDGKREVFWPRSKDDGTQWQPGLWGTWILE